MGAKQKAPRPPVDKDYFFGRSAEVNRSLPSEASVERTRQAVKKIRKAELDKRAGK